MNTNGSRKDHSAVVEPEPCRRNIKLLRPGPEPLEQRIAPATFVVTNTNSSGPGSLRDAITQANDTQGFDQIEFKIDGVGVQVIGLSAADGPLPEIRDPVLIDGFTQDGSSPNSVPFGDPRTNAVLNVVLDGREIDGHGLTLKTSDSTIRGLVIMSFKGAGILITGTESTGNTVLGNFIGTDASGRSANPNSGGGIVIQGASKNTIGGLQPGGRNVISGNGANGIVIDSVFVEPRSGDGNFIVGNVIGLAIDGSPLGNLGNGIAIRDSNDQQIGGNEPNQMNFIAYNGGDGVAVGVPSPAPEGLTFGNRIRGNSIFDNKGLGINLGRDGVTLNDPGDVDGGANDRINFPVMQDVLVLPTISQINGTLQSTPDTTFSVEFFVSSTVDGSGFGEGARPIGSVSVTTDGAGRASFNFTASGDYRGRVFSATSTEMDAGNTSEFSLAYSPLVVTTVDDIVDSKDGLTSLREAILYANSDPDFSTITFNLPGDGVRSIRPIAELPDVTQPATIDGYSQPGSSPNTLGFGNDGILLVELNGSQIATSGQVFGLTLAAGNSMVRGLVINRFLDGGIQVIGPGNNVIVGNWIGTNPDGNSAPAVSNKDGIDIINSSGNFIGGIQPADHNIISGNNLFPINIRGGAGSTGNVIKGNGIGTTKDATAPLGNGGEIYIEGNGTILGGAEIGGRNIISTTAPGVDAIGIHSPNVVVQHNFIGLDLSGTVTLGVGGAGIHVMAPGAKIGGTNPGEVNFIAGAALGGIVIESDNTLVQGNYIGTDPNGALPRPNSVAGIVIARGSNNTIGGAGSGAGNTIALNNGDGVWVSGTAGLALGNSIRGNTIFGNSGLGIDLGPDGVTPNDALDLDNGANTLQNFPVITGAVRSVSGTNISGMLNSTTNSGFTIDFYVVNAPDPGGFGEGRVYLGSTTTNLTNAAGDVTFNFNIDVQIPQGSFITATATSVAGNTSEFSAARALSTIYIWDAEGGVGNINWEDPINWNLNNGVPGPGDTAILDIVATVNLPASRSVGKFQQSAGTLTSPVGVTLLVLDGFDWMGGIQGGSGITEIGSTATLNLSTAGLKTLTRTMIGHGTSNWVGGRIGGAGTFINNGIFHAGGNDLFTANFNNTPGAVFSQESGSNIFSRPFNSNGIVNIVGGDVRFDGGGTSGGTFSLAPGALVEFHNGPYQFNGAAFSGAGNVSFSGTHTFDAASSYNVTGTTSIFFAGTTTFNTSSTVTFGTLDLNNATLTGSSNMLVNSAFVWDRGALSGSGTTTIAAAATGTWSTGTAKTLDRVVINNGTLTGGNLSGTGSITNNGIFNSSNSTPIAVAFANTASGTFNQLGGFVTFSAPFVNAGALNATGGTLQFNNGILQVGGTTVMGGGTIGGTFGMQGGTLTGAGTIAGSLSNTGGIIRPGGSGAVGTLNITGNFNQGAGGTLAVDLGGTGAAQFDALAVGGTATLGGTLNVTNIGGFIPVVGNQFRVVSSSGNPGSFGALTGATTGISQQPDNSGLILQANALVYTWDGGAGPGNTSWFEPLNWDLDFGFPGPADTAILSNAANNTITIPDSLSVGTFRQSAGTVTSGPSITFTILNTYDWAGGTQAGAGATSVPTGATLNFSLGNTTLNSRTLSIAGNATDNVSGGSLTLTNGAILNISGIVDYQDDDDILTIGTGTSIVVNQGGVLRKSAGAGVSEIQPAITINGTIDSQLGTLRLSNVTGGNNATLNAKLAAQLEFAAGTGAFSGTTTFAGGGVTRIFDANLQFNGPTSLNGAGTTLDIAGSGTIAIANTLTVPVDTFLGLAVGTLAGTGTIDIGGSFNWASGTMRGTGVTNVLPSGIVGMSSLAAKTLSVRTLNLAGDALLIGNLAVENGATLNLAAELTLASDADITSSSSGSINVQSGGVLGKVVGTGVSDIAPGVAVTNTGRIQVDNGTLRIGNAAGGNNAIFQSASGTVLEITGGNGAFTGTTGNNGGAGILRIGGGNLQFGGPISFTGSGARFEIINGTVSLANTFTIGAGATFALTSGAVAGSGNISVGGALEWNGGVMNGPGTTLISPGATAALGGSADKQLSGRTFVNDGVTNWSGTGQITLNNAMIINGGTFNLQSNAVVAITGATGGTINNLATGTLAKTGGAGVSIFSAGIVVNNAGTIAAQSGTLDLGANFTQTAGITLLGPGGLAAPGTLIFQGGELRGTGTIGGSVNNTGAIVRPGGNSASGAIAITGSYTQGAGGTLTIEVGGLTAGTQFDQINVGGIATIDGAFEVALLGGFTPPTGSQFQVLNAVSRLGAFATETITPGLSRQYTPSGVLLLGPAAPPSTIVTTELDIVDAEDGLVSLREAITFANANAGLDTITFNIPGGGVRTIALTSALPVITDAVVIDGYTQPGASPNTSINGNNSVLLIELNGSGAGAVSGLNINGGGSTVRGLVLNGFGGEGAVYLTGAGGNVVAGNLIGTNAVGNAAGPTNFRGVFISGSSNNVIGGTNPGDRNVISASQHIGIDIAFGAANNLVQGNFIGTDKTGTAALGDTAVGVFINNSAGNIIGGTTAGARNIISGHSQSPGSQGVSIAGGAGATANLVQGNYIGTDVTGTVALGNSTGIIIAQGAQGNTIGGNVAGSANVISGNTLVGVQLSDGSTTGNTIAGNFIGTDISGTVGLGNTTHGILIDSASGNMIGGINAADGNLIAHNGLEGITIFAGTGNAILRNSIHSNGGFEIDLGGNGFTPNDLDDLDSGANNLQNFPVLTLATPDAAGTRVTGTLNSSPNATFRIEFFQSDIVDGNGVGEGKVFLAFQDITTDGSGNATFSVVVPASLAVGQFVTATATHSSLTNTSEFAVAAQVRLPGGVSISDGIVVEGDSGTRTIVFTATLNQAAGTTVTVNYNTADLTALAGLDYDSASGVLTFGATDTVQTFSITVRSDTLAEFRERFMVTLSGAQGIGIDDGDGVGIIQDDDHHSLAVGQGSGNSFRVYTVNGAGATLQAELQPFAAGFKGGVRVATGDVTGDGIDDFIAGAGLGGRGRIRVFDGETLEPVAGALGDFSAYGNFYRGGVFVANGDVNGDGHADVIVSPSAGSHNEVRIFSGADGSMLNAFQALNRGSGGVRVAAGDVNGDGLADIIVGSGLGSKVRVFDALSGTILPGGDIAAFERSFRGGVFVAAGDVNNDGIDDIIASAGSKSATIKTFEQGVPEPNNRTFSAYSGAFRGVHVAAGDINGDGVADIIATKGGKTDGKLHVFQGTSLDELFAFTPFGKSSVGNYLG
jgi:CSLREA domain-containing protein